MNNLTMWRGSVVDKFLEKVIIPKISTQNELDIGRLAEDVVQFAQSQFRFSERRDYADAGLNKTEAGDLFCILDVHELGKVYSETELGEAYDDMRRAVQNIPRIVMPDGQLLVTFLKDSKSLLPNVTNRSADIESCHISPQIDLIAYHNYKPTVIDWKLSESFVSDYSRQLVICGIAIYLNRQRQTDKPAYLYEDITLYEVNLLQAKVKQHDFTEERVAEVTDYINLTGGDLELLHASYDEADPDDFEPTENVSSCMLCNFRPFCTYLLTHNNEYDEKAYAEYVQAGQLV
jgi:hypothetical protein